MEDGEKKKIGTRTCNCKRRVIRSVYALGRVELERMLYLNMQGYSRCSPLSRPAAVTRAQARVPLENDDHYIPTDRREFTTISCS